MSVMLLSQQFSLGAYGGYILSLPPLFTLGCGHSVFPFSDYESILFAQLVCTQLASHPTIPMVLDCFIECPFIERDCFVSVGPLSHQDEQ